MKIKTKFNKGQRVYLLYNNKIVQRIILSIEVNYAFEYLTPVIWYGLEHIGKHKEEELFATKQELIDSL